MLRAVARSKDAHSEAWRQAAYMLHTSVTASDSSLNIFDGELKARHRDRAARYDPGPDPLLDEVADRLLDRLKDCTRAFESVLVLGGAGRQVAERLEREAPGTRHVTHVDTSQAMLDALARLHAASARSTPHTYVHWTDTRNETLPVAPGTYDAVVACLGLHWINDVPGVLTQCRHALKPDGLFLGAMLGGATLQELRIACTLAQQEREGGVAPRLSPLAQVRDAGNLLTRAGLTIPAVDVDDIQVQYRDAMQLVRHLRQLAETNALTQRRAFLPRDSALATAAIYSSLFGKEGEPEQGIPATFQVIYLTGWAPDPSQRGPARRGTATVSFGDLQKDLGTGPQAADESQKPGTI
ncbi:NDUFAF5 [Auxenochlorella protothecoides x Auxenochlorella symbiontica]